MDANQTSQSVSRPWSLIGLKPDDENVLQPEVAQRLVRYGVKRGLLRHRTIGLAEFLSSGPLENAGKTPGGKENYGA